MVLAAPGMRELTLRAVAIVDAPLLYGLFRTSGEVGSREERTLPDKTEMPPPRHSSLRGGGECVTVLMKTTIEVAQAMGQVFLPANPTESLAIAVDPDPTSATHERGFFP